MQNHYLASGIIPVFLVSPTNTTVPQNTTATFYSVVEGTSPLSYQWYDLTTGAPVPVSGQTNASLVLTNVSLALNNEQYDLVASNTYGMVTSPPVTLTVAQGPPVLQTDLLPTYNVFVGIPLVLSAAFSGSAPFTYQWAFNGKPLSDNGQIIGSHTNSLTINPAQFTNSGTFQLWVSNTFGTNETRAATVNITPYLAFNGRGSGWSLNGSAEGGYISSGVLQLTDGNANEAFSSFYGNTVYVGGFQASFTYQVPSGPGGADGTAFVIQNDLRGPAATGGGGGGLGYTGITPSISLQFNINTANTFGSVVGMGFAVNGVNAEVAPTPPVVIDNGDPINVVVTYMNGVETVSLQDATTLGTYSTSMTINIPADIGTNRSYVGFTGASGGAAAIQQVSNFQFISLVNLNAQLSGTNLVLSWPTGSGVYQLQSATQLGTTNWVNVTNAAAALNGQNQVTAPQSGANTYYRLELP